MFAFERRIHQAFHRIPLYLKFLLQILVQIHKPPDSVRVLNPLRRRTTWRGSSIPSDDNLGLLIFSYSLENYQLWVVMVDLQNKIINVKWALVLMLNLHEKQTLYSKTPPDVCLASAFMKN